MRLKVSDIVDQETQVSLRRVCSMRGINGKDKLLVADLFLEIKKVSEGYDLLRTELIKKYGEVLPGGGMKVKKEDEQHYYEEISEILKEEKDLNISKLPYSIKEELCETDINSIELCKIYWLFEEKQNVLTEEEVQDLDSEDQLELPLKEEA